MQVFALLPLNINAIRATVSAGADRDDIVDALACLVIAHRIASGTATIPHGAGGRPTLAACAWKCRPEEPASN